MPMPLQTQVGGGITDGGDVLKTWLPARMVYHLGAAAKEFRCRVALTERMSSGAGCADFAVCADGREVAIAREVAPGQVPRALVADVRGAHLVELLVTASQPSDGEALWLEPEFDAVPAPITSVPVIDPLGRSEITPLPPLPPAERCVVVTASAGFARLLDDALGSLLANGECGDARIVVLLLGECPECEGVIARYRALPVRCRLRRQLTIATKATLYAAARIVDARRYLCLDADTLVLESLAPVFAALDALPSGTILAAREGNGRHFADLGAALESENVYQGARADIDAIVGESSDLDRYPLVVNSGVFAGGREAMLALDGALRAMPGAAAWLDARPSLAWREQFLFNLALARLDCAVELDSRYNVQLHTTRVEPVPDSARPAARWNHRPVAVAHLNGTGRSAYPELTGRYAAAGQAISGGWDGDGYGAFLRALRRWLGYSGLDALAWSFYSTRDGFSGHVSDPSVMPVLALLHYLVRANGCRRVIETGTARGVSAACLAAAVAHRPGGRIVAFDPLTYSGRQELWSELPVAIRACIDERREDSVAGMRALREARELFDAALLDSFHSEAHLWAEFELARELVVPNGLILIHDACSLEDVITTLDRVECAGYGVTRLLASRGAEGEDAGLGLAVIENRVREAGAV